MEASLVMSCYRSDTMRRTWLLSNVCRMQQEQGLLTLSVLKGEVVLSGGQMSNLQVSSSCLHVSTILLSEAEPALCLQPQLGTLLSPSCA